ncbi:MSHA biogenesis protein MshI [Oceanisphaera arctica]|uniref:MSHA biogenesis protein MshI n=1 Tax=Oceanisphaera arctica TaxID=641510 RepID=A0A2P5TR95_9GAMM|nr:MSHA biogenesis protein MshI [Oceanisphaera arctica]PPL18289.1 MSHA biogenesis protein MshI [Oceanisphaera arctica]GHA12153.1 MSHA biogenesis protein MshI [Oceanisphaera arctica]
MRLRFKVFNKARPTSRLGVCLTRDAVLVIDEQASTRLYTRAISAQETPASALVALIEQQQWQGRGLALTLGRGWYQQLQVPRPALPDEELLQALPWCVGELINEPVDSLVFDYIDLPPAPNGEARIAVYYSARAPLAALVEAVTPLCPLLTIGVDELAMANLLPPENHDLVLYKAPGQELTLLFIHQQQWLFSRIIRGFQSLDDDSVAVEEFNFDTLLLELQRSIDYATGQLKLAAPEHWYLALPDRITPALQQSINRVFNMQAHSLTEGKLPPEALPALGILRRGD